MENMLANEKKEINGEKFVYLIGVGLTRIGPNNIDDPIRPTDEIIQSNKCPCYANEGFTTIASYSYIVG